MRHTIVRLSLGAAMLAGSGLAMAAETLPARKAGLWESKTTSADANVTARQCIDEKTDQLAESTLGGLGTCSKRALVKTSTGYATESDCKIGPISASGKGTITGDFNSRIRIETTSVLTGIPNTKEPVTKSMIIEATWLGPCEKGQSPGDIILPDGKVVKMPVAPR